MTESAQFQSEGCEMPRPVKGFALGQEGNNTQIHLIEYADGCFGLVLYTKRDNMEPFRTELYLSAKTFGFLCDALLMAGHNPGMWKSIDDVEVGK